VADNIARWKEDTPSWFKIEMIPDEFLPANYRAEAGSKRRRSSLGEIVCISQIDSGKVLPEMSSADK